MPRIALIGGGKMGSALLGGLLDGGWDADALAVAEVDPDRRRELEQLFPKVRIVPSPAWAVADADVVVVAVKPGDVAPSLQGAESSLRIDALVLSIAAGVTIATLEALAPGRPVVRAMPNTPALVGLGASAIAAGRHAGDPHLALASRLLGAVGIVVTVAEPALDAVTGLSGSGPAYVFLVAEAMIEAGVLEGLPRDVAEQLVVQTFSRLGNVAGAERRRARRAARRGHLARRYDRGRSARARIRRCTRRDPRRGDRRDPSLTRARTMTMRLRPPALGHPWDARWVAVRVSSCYGGPEAEAA